jgi:protein-S-isoprenylcysteine O-methyltransferase Ste14
MNFFGIFQFASLCLFLLLFVGRSVWLHRSGTKVFVIGRGKKGFIALMEIVFVVILLAWIYEIFRSSIQIQFSILPPLLSKIWVDLLWLKFLGVILITAGLIIFSLALVAFGRSWRIGIDANQPGKLITTGIFSVTRNPVFVFFNLYFIGIACLNPNLFFTGLAFMALFGIHFHILNEEKFLEKHYGKSYKEYRKETHRYF